MPGGHEFFGLICCLSVATLIPKYYTGVPAWFLNIKGAGSQSWFLTHRRYCAQ